MKQDNTKYVLNTHMACSLCAQSMNNFSWRGKKANVIPPMTLLCDNMHEHGWVGHYYNMS